MRKDIKALEQQVEQALATPEYQDHPLHQVLAQLWEYNQDHWSRVEQLIRVSDSYQDMILQREKTLGERFDKHLRQLEKITRISDRYQTSLREANLELEQASYVDALTGLPNRRKMLRRLKMEFDTRPEIISLAMIDVDFFKRINDEHGHLVGDEVLIAIGQLIDRQVGEMGHIARWGGEEFLVVFAQEDTSQVSKCLQQLIDAIAQETFEGYDGRSVKTSISIGLSRFKSGDTIDTLITRADDALYRAKHAGRNQVIAI
ncbi:diguanylate cyclase [Marinomonas ostreistagni]|uniref:diguanylate cyclase n=1 Tax=Marinomonas ostreistagni TaxID=359209 RepID=UPI00194FDA7A|nr:diguanylate cyclase [Marinomonas ostreistagni]MBM6552273.1 GGDEF domain-containing protein [Marinomonas ostreistagni]